MAHHRINVHFGAPVKANCLCDGRRYSRIQAHGDADVIPAGLAGEWTDDADCTILRIAISDTLVRSIGEQLGARAVRRQVEPRLQWRDPRLHHLASALGAELEADAPSDPLYAESLCTALVVQLLTGDHALVTDSRTLAPRVAARVVDYRAASVKKLADVQDQVKAKVLAEQSAALAKKAGEEKLAAVKQSNSADGFAAAQTVSRQQGQAVPPQALAAILRADAAKLPATIGVDLGAQGYALYRINKVLPPAKVDEARRAADAQQLAQVAGQADFNAYYEALKARAKVKVNAGVIDATKPANTADDAS